MKKRAGFKASMVLAAIAGLSAVSTGAMAQTHGGGGHYGGAAGGHYGGPAGGHYYGYGGYGHPGYGYGGWHGGYYGGWRGGYYGGWGWRGGWGWGGWGWGWGGLGIGLYFAALPAYYSTYWWGGVPYYYANNTYYVYDGGVGQYETVAPPQGLQDKLSSEGPPPGTAGAQQGTDLIAYPAKGQSEEQQGKDKYECHHWAATQTGFDPVQGSNPNATGEKRSDYMRAQAACLEGRGYTVK